jgi:hypothetical protein
VFLIYLVVNHNLINDEDEIDLLDENITTFVQFNMNNFPMLCTIGEVLFEFIIRLIINLLLILQLKNSIQLILYI